MPSLDHIPTMGALLAAWLLWALISHRVIHNPRGDMATGFVWLLLRVYVRAVHMLRVVGLHNAPTQAKVDGRPIVVVANHTAGIDPLLVMAALPFHVRWMMGVDMRVPALDGGFAWGGVILVERFGKADLRAMREASATLAGKREALGIFPEGRLRDRPGQLFPFKPGVGVLVARANALVLPVLIEGTPVRQSPWWSLVTPSLSRVTFHPLIDYRALGVPAGEISQDLRGRYLRWLGLEDPGADQVAQTPARTRA
jgi:1-acyl-sn-glycerol-3-phosphate acyltransferase